MKPNKPINLGNILRITVVIELISIFASIAIGEYLMKDLPVSLQNYWAWEENRGFTTFEIVLMFISLFFLLVYFVAALGLIFLKQWAKFPYLVAGLSMFILSPLLGPDVSHGLEAAIADVGVACFGINLALLLFCNVFPNQ